MVVGNEAGRRATAVLRRAAAARGGVEGWMSKRYGRNQRRRHREKIAALDASVGAWATLAGHLGKKQEDLEDLLRGWDAEVRRLLGENSAFRMGTAKEEVQDIQWFNQILAGVNPHDFMGEALRVVSSPMDAYRIVNLEKMLVHIAADPDGFSTMISLIIVDRTKSAYCIDRETFLKHGVTPKAIAYIAQDIAQKLAKSVNMSMLGTHG
jgi:hypothetical protein